MGLICPKIPWLPAEEIVVELGEQFKEDFTFSAYELVIFVNIPQFAQKPIHLTARPSFQVLNQHLT